MARESASVAKRFQNAKTFTEHLKLALEFHKEPQILQNHSPLAEPWFLHQNETADMAHTPAPNWGAVLSEQIWQAAGQLWRDEVPQRHEHLVAQVEAEAEQGRAGKYDFFLLELNYFKRIYRPHPKNQSTIYNDILYISRATHDRHLRDALERLSTILLKKLRPSIRLESPRLPTVIVGRERLREQCRASLLQKQTVNLVGSGGIGKTTLGAMIRNRWGAHNTFWYTIQPGFNDSVNSLLFALANFLNKHGSSALWQQLVADDGKIEDLSLAQGLLRADLENLPDLPLLCFDEVGMLHQGYPEQANQAHQQILTLLSDLPQRVPLLLIGHRVMIEGDVTHTPELLSRAEMGDWLTQIQCPYETDDLDKLAAYTAGNPRLMNLCVALFMSSDPLMTTSLGMAITSLPTAPGLAPVWDRLRGRLSSVENELLHAISIFRTPAPKDAWVRYEDDDPNTPDIGLVLDNLLDRQILQADESGGVFILPSLREIVYTEMSIEQREQFHLNGAGIYALRGEYTEAAWHLMKADRPELAVEMWYPERENEVQRGNGAVALKIFEQISVNRLRPTLQKQLAILRAELNLYNANNDKAVAVLEQIDWKTNDPLSVEAFQQWGRILESMGEMETAREKLTHGLESLAWVMEKYARLHVEKGYLYRQERQMGAANREADLAMFHAEILHGSIQDDLGNFDQAADHYATALNIAQRLDDQLLIARAEFTMGVTYARQEENQQAESIFNQAITRFQKLGNKVQEMRVRSNLAAMLMNTGQNTTGIAEATKALTFFEQMGADFWIASNANNIADAYLEKGDIEQATIYAQKVIDQEEPSTYGYGVFTFGEVQRQKGEWEAAINTLKMSLDQATKTEDRYLTAFCYQALGQCQIGLKDKQKAVEVLQAAEKLFLEMDIPSELEKTQQLIRSIA